ncbi:MAG: PD-(D/E)XK nuclease family protein [Candidatus Dependentiae bacterium]|nr:PD-(D/E)XK nuclease family protein [Candidatus Dependentiae bacterium]
MRKLLIIGFVFVGLQNFIFAGKSEKFGYKAEKSVGNRPIKNFKASSSSSASASSAAGMDTNEIIEIPFKKTVSDFYKSPQRKSRLYDKTSHEPFILSRSRIEAFLACKVCFYLDRKKGLITPPGFPFSLNNAVDELQKKSFDQHRVAQTVHPLCAAYGLNLVPFQHPDLDAWRNSLSEGLKCNMPGTNIVLQGGIDDIWINLETRELFIVDYKATAKNTEVTLDAAWQDGYKRQVEIYQALLRSVLQDTEYTVSDTAYFVYSNGRTDVENFNDELKFKTTLIPYQGNTSWIQPTVMAAYECLQADTIPSDRQSREISEKYCDLCRYVKTRKSLEESE